jgi:CRP-like cAMP-binding protein
VAILGTGDFFGEGCLAGQPLRLSSAKTLVKSSIWRLDKAAVVRALRRQLANFWQGGPAAADHRADQSEDPRRNDRHDAPLV